MKPENYPSNPESLWKTFFDFTQTPRPSKEEGAIRKYLVKIANDNNLKHVVDKAGNVIIYVPGRNGREEDAAIATIFEKDIKHPPLELLFTVDEETGLNGALGLETSYLSGKKMLNLDTEEWGSLYIGCAGGIDYEFNQKFELIEGASDLSSVRIAIAGFIGGHSGLDIHEQRGNAIKLLGEILGELGKTTTFELKEFTGGKAHNIIPREASAIIRIDSKEIETLDDVAAKIEKRWRSFLPKDDKDFEVSFEHLTGDPNLVVSKETLDKLVRFILLMPHGAHKYDLAAREIVSLSNNLAKVILKNGEFYSQSSLRFFDREEIRSLESQLKLIGKFLGLNCESHSEYPSWKPVRENPVLETVKSCYVELYGREPVVTAIHAGLECGILKSKLGKLDVVSFGPTITGAHSPDERVLIPSVNKFWDLYKSVLQTI